ncbi:hypothetical protein PybrP1_011739 [[Pythium] brassicae (nom. inval.)]|nr:hypothetical protein PybrP1_011739 [[Pythium] brassicae (nom. inval.)]
MALDRLDWKSLATKVIFQMGDAPPHGPEYSSLHSYTVSVNGSASNDEPTHYLFRRMMKIQIDNNFGKVTMATDKMVALLSTALGRDVKVFNVEPPFKVAYSVVTATISSYTELESSSQQSRMKITPAPFAEGSVRLAYFAKEYFRVRGDNVVLTETRWLRRSTPREVFCEVTGLNPERMPTPAESQGVVCKVFKVRGRESTNGVASNQYCYMVAMEMQMIASYLAKQYNLIHVESDVSRGFAISYLKCSVLALKDINTGTCTYFIVEKRMKIMTDQWFKVINNADTVTRGVAKLDAAVVEYLMAFAH